MQIYLKKSKCRQINLVLTDLMPELLEIVNRNNIYTEIYLKLQYAILPMSQGHEPRRSLCRMGLC